MLAVSIIYILLVGCFSSFILFKALLINMDDAGFYSKGSKIIGLQALWRRFIPLIKVYLGQATKHHYIVHESL